MTNTSTAKGRLADAAFALFDERGYEQTTIEDIAARAGLSRTTFFRSFRSKEDVIFPDHAAILAAIRARLAASTPQTALLAVSEAARLVLLQYLTEGQRAHSRYALISTVPALRARETASVQQYQRTFVDYISDWMGSEEGPVLRAELMASAVITAHNHVLRRWLRAEGSDPEAEFDAAMTEVLELFAERDQDTSAVLVLRTTRNLQELAPELQRLLG